MQAYTYGDNISKQHKDRVVRVLGQLIHEVRILVLGRGLTYVHVELVLKEFEGDYLSSGEGDVGRGHILPEETKVFVQFPHVVETPWSPEVVFGVFVPLVYPIQGEAIK